MPMAMPIINITRPLADQRSQRRLEDSAGWGGIGGTGTTGLSISENYTLFEIIKWIKIEIWVWFDCRP